MPADQESPQTSSSSFAQKSDQPARSLGVVALVLFVLFLSVLPGVLFPLQLFDPTWQLRFSGALVNGALAPLLGLALLRLAVIIDPLDALIRSRWRFCSGLAVVAALGFLLLLPLQFQASFRQYNATLGSQSSLIRGAETRLVALRRQHNRRSPGSATSTWDYIR